MPIKTPVMISDDAKMRISGPDVGAWMGVGSRSRDSRTMARVTTPTLAPVSHPAARQLQNKAAVMTIGR